tara:strand:+ start:680 stop:2221 length:1542 start_codon:yes stop_codon:yes gene_type:complete
MIQRLMIAAAMVGTSASFAGTTECTPQQTAKLTADDGAADDNYGWSVDISEGVAVIGAYQDDDNGDRSGSAYVFEQSVDGTWQQTAKLMANDGAEDDRFGFDVAISNGVAVIGAHRDDDNGSNSGSAYVFEQLVDGTWQQTDKLTANDGASNDSFGDAVAILNGVVFIGAYRDDDNGSSSGSVYVFKQLKDGTWQQIDKLTADDGASNDSFGSSIAISNGFAVIGSDGDDDNGSASGSAYVFEQLVDGTWQQAAKLTANDGAEQDRFGFSVSISDGIAVIGNYGDDAFTGSAYVFEQSVDGTWQQTTKLMADDGTEGDLFGQSVAISNGVAAIGAKYNAENGDFSGSAYIYQRLSDGTWQQTAKITADDGVTEDLFGQSVAISDGVAIIGAHKNSGNVDFSGSAYVFDQLNTDCNQNGICDFDEIVADPLKDTNTNGILDECEFGACCISTTVVCTITIEHNCLQFGGVWQGLGTTCEESDCPTTCLGDVNGDGVVNVNDILLALEQYGVTCP